jgi:hypothetical protein
MANEVMSVTDPLGNTIFLLEGICAKQEGANEAEIYDNAATVIQKPALMIRVEVDHTVEQHYFRSVGWHSTMLIIASFTHDRWESKECIMNPSSEELSALLKKGKQMI